MEIQAELSQYTLKTDPLESTIRRFIERLSRPGTSVIPSAMSTPVAGGSEEVFHVISQRFAKACTDEEVVLVAKFPSVCPIWQY